MKFKCEEYLNIRQNSEYENWSDECWPNPLFHEKEYPCWNCKYRQERYDKFLIDSIKRSEKNPNSNIYLFRNKLKKDGGKFVEFGSMGMYGLLVACTSTLEDYYYVYIDKDLNVKFDTCVDKYTVLDEIPANLSILNYLKNNQSKELFYKVKKFINESKFDKLITKIYI